MTATTEGVKKNFDVIVATAVVFSVITTSTTVLRVLAKKVTGVRLGFEDYTIFLALTLYIITEGLLIKCIAVGRWTVTINDKYDTLYTEYASIYSIFYFAIVGLSIASVSLLYRRIFIKTYVRIITTTILVADLGWWISSTILEIILPATYPETYPGNPGQKSITNVNYLTWWLAAGIIEVLLVGITIMIPLRELYRHTGLSIGKKLCLGLAFSMSYVCIGTGIARLATLYRPHASHFDGSIGDIWINTHLGSAIMGANLPLCWPVIKHRKRLLSSLTSWGRTSSIDSSETRSRTRSVGSTVQVNNTGEKLTKVLSGATIVQTPTYPKGVRNVGGFNRAFSYDLNRSDSDLEAGDNHYQHHHRPEVTEISLDSRTNFDSSRNRSEENDLIEIQRAPDAHLRV